MGATIEDSKMSDVVPIKAGFENPRAYLLKIAEDEEIESFAMIVLRKNGATIPAHIGCSRADLAFFGAMLTQMALETDDD